MQAYHVPALFEESMDALAIRPDGTYVDLTFGGGGHSRGILQRLSAKGRLFGFDQDRDARANVPRDDRFRFVESNFRFMRGWLRALGVEGVDGILADLGVSSHHFDTQRRGFSFRFDAPLDMRMNQRAGFSAADVIGTYDRQRLTRILRDYGELDAPHRVAQCIVQARERAPLETIDALIEAVAPVTPRGGESKFLAKLFQAVRIEVNGEMDALEMMLEQSLRVLRPGGRLCVITYHSLEDRMVKNFLRSGNFEGKPEKDFFGRLVSPWNVVTRKAVVPSAEEIGRNPRARSAKLRAAEKTEE
ncbi:16S rRNA (cytosine(1402)-N(4))-methyltransferase RsmH [uncultured Alistipes sp.]|uniref:16S rRNA (cytosine(1402)-N(4))-methyltransferase RsmH n=1 Tax=uncultured Alistipes sp. TaxID=538949 RepID=UPI00260F8CD8|nr:16S rRNA (cytosine(1402)-N(4))-methyltransferase RsmH [uncultured Alistipes sp.]